MKGDLNFDADLTPADIRTLASATQMATELFKLLTGRVHPAHGR